MDDDKRAALRHLFSLAFQYYVAARQSAAFHLMPVAGNLYHHAIEMFLKGALCGRYMLQDFQRKFGHDLITLWDAFRKEYPTAQLDEFDLVIAELNHFERLRYPDAIIIEERKYFSTYNGQQLLTSPVRLIRCQPSRATTLSQRRSIAW